MIDLVYKTVTTIINKENNGYVSPDEFNKIANFVQEKIFKGYFEDHNRDDNRDHYGRVSKGYSNLPFNQRQKINQFSDEQILVNSGNQFYELPDNLYFIEDDGLYTTSGSVVEEVERREIGYLLSSISKPTTLYPIYTRYPNRVKVYPAELIEDINLRYLRKPNQPKWTYFVLPDGNPAFNPTANDFQDFELHESEFSNIVLKILMFFGVNLRESEVIQVANAVAESENTKENN